MAIFAMFVIINGKSLNRLFTIFMHFIFVFSFGFFIASLYDWCEYGRCVCIANGFHQFFESADGEKYLNKWFRLNKYIYLCLYGKIKFYKIQNVVFFLEFQKSHLFFCWTAVVVVVVAVGQFAHCILYYQHICKQHKSAAAGKKIKLNLKVFKLFMYSYRYACILRSFQCIAYLLSLYSCFSVSALLISIKYLIKLTRLQFFFFFSWTQKKLPIKWIKM